jgi:transposase
MALQRLPLVVRFDETIDTHCSIAGPCPLEQPHIAGSGIDVIFEDVPHYRCKAVQGYLKASGIQLIFFHTYCPDLKLIQRLRRSLEQRVLYNRYSRWFTELKKVCDGFSRNANLLKAQRRFLLREKSVMVWAI